MEYQQYGKTEEEPDLALSKADFGNDVKKKPDFINKHGLLAWENLPLKPNTSDDGLILSKADFGKNVAAKAKWISEHGEDAWSKLPLRREGQ